MRLLVFLALLLGGCADAYSTCKMCKHACEPNSVKYCDAHKCECFHQPK